MTELEKLSLDKKLEEKLGKIHDGYEKWAKWTLRILIGLVASFVFGAFSTTYLIGENKARIDDIQEQRTLSVRETCEAQNDRNVNTKARLDELVAKRAGEGTEEEQARRGESVIAMKLLIDALAPFTPDCEALVQQRVPSG